MFEAAAPQPDGWEDGSAGREFLDATVRPRYVVAIPARDEAGRIGACLEALARQDGPAPDGVLLFLNNCLDGSRARAASVAAELGLNLRCVEAVLAPHQASAGFARRAAMEHAAEGLDAHDILMTTDADGRVAPNWLSATRSAIARGVDAVCGRALIDPLDAAAIPAALHEDDARECRLSGLLDELATLIDPDPHDPWPRHTEHSGASIAVTVGAWRRAGGIPPVAVGEDRAFIEQLRRLDMRVRHAPDAWVTVSGRMDGRAAGGMADTIRRRMAQQDEFADASVEPALLRVRRLELRARLRALKQGVAGSVPDLAASAGMRQRAVRRALARKTFGEAWASLEHACPALRTRPVRFGDLAHEIGAAERLCEGLRTMSVPPLVLEAG